jgi:hypothetical protein
MMRPSCAHREPSASFAAGAVKTQGLERVAKPSIVVRPLSLMSTRLGRTPKFFANIGTKSGGVQRFTSLLHQLPF